MANLKTRHITILAGKEGEIGCVDGKGENARFFQPNRLTYLKESKELIVVERSSASIRSVNLEGEVRTITCNPATMEGAHIKFFPWFEPCDVIIHQDGRLIVSDCALHAIVSISKDRQNISVLSGGKRGYKDGKVSEALFDCPYGLSISRSGDIYVCDKYNDCIRIINSQNIVSTLKYSNMDIPTRCGPILSMKYPVRIEVIDGNVFFSEEYSHNLKILHNNNVSIVHKCWTDFSFAFINDNSIIISEYHNKSMFYGIKFQIPLPKTNEEEKLEDGT